MKVIDTVNRCITQYPSLYLKANWEESKFAVLHQFFVVLGNGIEWAHTKDKKKAGYLTSPIHYKKNGEWERKYDLPYGKVKFELDPRFFKERCFEFGRIKKNEDPRFERLIGARLSLDYHDYDNIETIFESDLKNKSNS